MRIQRTYWCDETQAVVTEIIDPKDFYIQPSRWQRVKFFLKGFFK